MTPSPLSRDTKRNKASVEDTLRFIRQCVAGRCDWQDLSVIRTAINNTEGMDLVDDDD